MVRMKYLQCQDAFTSLIPMCYRQESVPCMMMPSLISNHTNHVGLFQRNKYRSVGDTASHTSGSQPVLTHGCQRCYNAGIQVNFLAA